MAKRTQKASLAIGTLNEKPLHAALKGWYARKGDRMEVRVDGSQIDIVRGKTLIEIQTGTFASIRRKLWKLTNDHRVRLVYPIAQEKWIVRVSKDGKKQLGCRRSPKRGTVEGVFEQLVSIPKLMADRNFSLEVLMTREEEVRKQGLSRSWRRKGWGVLERRLLEVADRWIFHTPADLADLLPEPAQLPDPFDTAQLAEALSISRSLAQKMTYCLRALGVVCIEGKHGRSLAYQRTGANRPGA